METTSTLQMELFYLGKLTTKNITYRKVNVKYGVHYRCTLLAWDLTIRIAVDRSLGWWGWGLGGWFEKQQQQDVGKENPRKSFYIALLSDTANA